MNGDVVAFTGPNFEGRLVSRMRDVSLHPCNGRHMSNDEYFRNRSRQYQWTVQGRFKRRIRFDEIVTGQDFGRPFRNMPSSKMVKKGLDLLKHKLPETFEWYEHLYPLVSKFNSQRFLTPVFCILFLVTCFQINLNLNTHFWLDAKAFALTERKISEI